MDLLGICRMLGVLAGGAMGVKKTGSSARAPARDGGKAAPAGTDESEFDDLLRSLGAIDEAWDPVRALALKQLEIDALRKDLSDLRDLGARIAEIEQRQLAESGMLRPEIARLRRALVVARGKAVRGRAILRARRRGLAAKLRDREAALTTANDRLAQLKERYERRRADIEKLRHTIRELRDESRERNAELRELRRQVRVHEAHEQRSAKWRERVEQEVRSLLESRRDGHGANLAETGRHLAALFAHYPDEASRGSRGAREED